MTSPPLDGSIDALAIDSPHRHVNPPDSVRKNITLALLSVATLVVLSPPGTAGAEARSRVFLNGEPISVHFSDGDSFRMQQGRWSGRNSRIAGFNTLESFGPAHRWGDWHPYELWINAKQATHNARHGIWHCTTEGETDTYGRVLVECLDLAISQISQGYAHAMNIDDTPARPEYLRAQQAAIRARRGMWAHGVPDFVLTSLHSADEDRSRESHYNRMVSTRDGHSESMEHNNTYSECEVVCATESRADADRVRAQARALRADPRLAPLLADTSNVLLIELVDRYARLEILPEYTSAEVRAALEPVLAEARAAGRLGGLHETPGGCMIYAQFERRYGQDRAVCLRGRGDWR